MNSLVVGVGGFVILLATLVALRLRTGNRFEVKNSDIVLALVPIGLWLLLTGKIKEFSVGDFKIVAAIEAASRAAVKQNVTKLPIETIRTEMKGQVVEIPSLIAGKAQALGFRLGHGGYHGDAITMFLEALSKSPSFKHLVIANPDGTLFALADGVQTAALVRSRELQPHELADWLNGARTAELQMLPGFIPASSALTTSTDTRTALEKMNKLDAQVLPVVDEAGRLAGIVDRSKLSASMLIDIAERVENR